MTKTYKTRRVSEKSSKSAVPKRFDISTRRQLQALTSPIRHQIHQIVDACGPCSARELAEHMDRSAESLYYHLHQMQHAGLLLKVGKGMGVRRSEAIFDVVGRPFRVDPEITAPRFLALVSECAAARLRNAGRSLDLAITDPGATRQGKYRSWRMEQDTVKLNKKNLEKMNKMIDDMLVFLRECNNASGDAMFSVTIATSRTPR